MESEKESDKLIGKKREAPKKNDKKKNKSNKKQKQEDKKEKDEKKNEIAWKNIAFNQEKNLKNEKFEYYYKTQFSKLFPTPEKFEELISKLREKLPCVFRISKAHPFHEGYKNMLLDESFLKKLLNEQYNLIKIDLKNLTNFKEWINLVYNININRMELKKNDLLKNFHKFIQFGVDGGVISRQEAVSMIPPMLMQTKSTDHLLDMCAAP